MARIITVPGHAALAHLAPRPSSPILAAVDEEEARLLRCADLDKRLFATVLGRPYPLDLLSSPEGRVAALEPELPARGVLLASTALWVHTGGIPPHQLVIGVADRDRGRWRRHTLHRTVLPHADLVTIGDRACASLARAAVDIARTAPPAQAVRALLAARTAGVSRIELRLALSHCRGAAAVGRPRAERIIEQLPAVLSP